MVNVHTVSTKKYESFIFLQTILVTNVFLLDHYFHQRWILCFCTFTVTLFLYSDFILTIAIIIIDYYYYYHYSEITIIVLGWLLCPPKVITTNSNQKIIDIIISILYILYFTNKICFPILLQ